jgi:hypothetical protein
MEKAIILVKTLVFSSLMAFSTLGYGQCKGFVKQVDFSALNAFEYCGEVKVAQMYHNSEADINHKMEANKRYRILADAQDYLGKVELNVINQKGDTVSMEVNTPDQRYWELLSSDKGKVEIQLRFTETATNSMDNAGCVVLAVGEMENNNLVKK